MEGILSCDCSILGFVIFICFPQARRFEYGFVAGDRLDTYLSFVFDTRLTWRMVFCRSMLCSPVVYRCLKKKLPAYVFWWQPLASQCVDPWPVLDEKIGDQSF